MANYIIDGSLLTNIAAAIRSKKGVSTTYTPAQMATAISGMAAGVDQSGTSHHVGINAFTGINISANDDYEATVSTSVVDLSKVAVVGHTISYFNGSGARLSNINTYNNRIRISTGDSAVRIASVGIDYVELKIY